MQMVMRHLVKREAEYVQSPIVSSMAVLNSDMTEFAGNQSTTAPGFFDEESRGE